MQDLYLYISFGLASLMPWGMTLYRWRSRRTKTPDSLRAQIRISQAQYDSFQNPIKHYAKKQHPYSNAYRLSKQHHFNDPASSRLANSDHLVEEVVRLRKEVLKAESHFIITKKQSLFWRAIASFALITLMIFLVVLKQPATDDDIINTLKDMVANMEESETPDAQKD